MSSCDRLVLRSLPKSIDAGYYNRVKLALLRLGEPLRITLPELADSLMILTSDEWLCVDPTCDERPLMAWLDFADSGRDSLVEPVSCTLELYHAHAGIMMGKALTSLETALNNRLTTKAEFTHEKE